jgi:hypothetical protein
MAITYSVGDKVRLVIREGACPVYGWGDVKRGDIGVIVDIDYCKHEYDKVDYTVKFPHQSDWRGHADELELVLDIVANDPRLSLKDTTALYLPWETTTTTAIDYNYIYPGTIFPPTYGFGYWEDEPRKTKMKTLTAKLRRFFNDNQKIQFKAGYIDECNELTDKGGEALFIILREKFDAELTALAKEDSDEQEKTK